MNIFLRDLLRIPTPVDLGWSKHNALGMRELTPYQEGKTWEDWQEHIKEHYPIRYFLAAVLPLWVKLWLIWPVGRARDWLLDHCIPSRRYHLFDLRGIDPLSNYRHGYIDPCTVFWLAGWGSLLRWHKEDGQHLNPEDWESNSSAEQKEALALVHYWTVERVERDRRCDDLYRAVGAISPTPENREAYEAANQVWLAYYQESERLDQAAWLRLAAIKDYLWD